MAQKPATAAAAPDPTNHSFEEILRRELGAIAERREQVFGLDPRQRPPGFEDPHKARTLGLAFSGGGIRSATFNLGIVQGLAERGLLKYVDYLSTVSGGGYIGSWLHGVIRTNFGGDPDAASKHLLSPSLRPVPGPPKDDPISFLRKFSNYLAPRPGAFSVDVWVIFLIWLRNVFLNQLILIPALSIPIVLALLFVLVEQIPAVVVWPPLLTFLTVLAGVIALVALIVVVVILVKNLGPVVAQSKGHQPAKTMDARKWEHRSTWIVPSLLVAAFVLGCCNLAGWGWPALLGTCAGFAMLFGLLQAEGGFVSCYTSQHPAESYWAIPNLIWMTAVCAAVTGTLVFGVWTTVSDWQAWDKVAFTMPLICLCLIAGVALQIGLMGADYPDAAREWIARIGSMVALACAAWTALFLLSVRAPQGFAWLIGWHGNTAIGTIAAWVVTTAAGVLAGRSEHSDGGGDPSARRKALDLLVRVAPIVFVVGYLLLLSYGVHAALRAVSPPMPDASAAREAPTKRLTVDVRVPETAPAIEVDVRGPEEKGWLDEKLEPVAAFAKSYPHVLRFVEGSQEEGTPTSLRDQIDRIVMISRWERPVSLLVFLVGSAFVVWVAARRININEFSLHHFYKNRLVRCYLGASNTQKRKPNYLTGFDPNDDFPIAKLTPSNNYRGPYPIVNVALNVNAGAELAQQERKAISFVFTPQFCGFAPSRTAEDEYEVTMRASELFEHGYRKTVGYSQPDGPRLGTALAISGAAANPNSGYSTSGPMAFLLTVFDARLGWWLGNPRSKTASPMQGPSFALWYLLSELLGQTTATSSFVNLSDGGHFDNLGLYELVKRRCRFIIIGDGEQDKDLTFGSLGGAIRKCRADFGVEIDIDPTPIRVTKDFSRVHCVVGTITYPEDESGPTTSIVGGKAQPCGPRARGWLLYVKSSLTGDEPADVIEYRSRFADFPHQSTADQFFDESQFESYRRLGLHVIREAFEGVDLTSVAAGPQPGALEKVFQALTRKWYAPPPVEPGDMSRLNDAYSDLIQRISDNQNVRGLMPALVLTSPNPPQPALNDEMRMLIVEAIQLMENVYTEYQLEDDMNRANPRNAGWMRVFRRWAQQSVVQQVWGTVADNYNTLFRDFMDKALLKPEEDMPPRN